MINVPENINTEDILNKANMFVKQMEDTIENPNIIGEKEEIKVGVDLGTCNIVITVLDKNNVPVAGLVRPVIEKMANIILQHIKGYDVETIYLVGGTCCLKDIEKVVEKYTNIKTIKPYNPLLVTPIGIAMSSAK